MSKGRTLKIVETLEDAQGNKWVLLQTTDEPVTDFTVPADWLAKGMKDGDDIRATEEMPGVVRFRIIANPAYLEDPAEDPAHNVPTPVTKLDEGDQFPLGNDSIGE